MIGARETADTSRAEVSDALVEGKRRTTASTTRATAGPRALLALQRNAGNAAVSALLAAKLKSPGEQAGADIDVALREIRREEPAVEPVEKGLRAAKASGVPVDLEGTKPPPSTLAVTKTGFGPASVAPKKAVPPTKAVAAVSPLGKAGAKVAKVGGGGKASPAGKGPAPAGPTAGGAGGTGGVGGIATGPTALAPDQLLQPPVPPTAGRPDDDPAFTQVTGRIKGFAKDKRAHGRAGSKAKEAQDAAVPPSGDVAGQAKAAKVDTMDAQRAGGFDKKAFIAAVKAAIEAKSPKTLKEADSYKESGKAGEVKGAVKGLVTEGTEGQAKDIETATEAPPDQSKAVPKPVTPMGPEQPGQAAAIPAAGAVPKPAPAEQLNLAAGKHEANQELADAEVSEQQLAESNEPEFQQALADKQAAAAHADTAPGQFRQHEQDVLDQRKTEANSETSAAVTDMQGSKGKALAQLVANKGKAKSKDETKRAEVTTKIQAIFAATEADVKKILDGIDPKVEAAFDEGEAAARAVFESYVAAKMAAYKKDRYGGWLGPIRWAKDKLLGMPEKVNEFYEAGRELYLKQMDGVISRVADIVGNDLTAAKQRIATGKAEIASYVKSLPADLKKVGADASKEIDEKFEQLESEVDSKQESIVDTLATKYVEARKGLDERIEALQAENKGLVDKAIGAIKAVINTIRQLAAMLRNVLARVAGVVGQIIKKPVEFLGNLIAGIKGGILKFKEKILDHLRKGLFSWLFGALAEAGVEIPETFDLRGIIKLLASIFGLTWTNIRNRLVKQIGEKAMGVAERGVSIFQLIAGQGLAGVWQLLLEKLGNIKEMILEQVKDFVVTKIITAGITWLISLLNPAAAFIKACKLIYDVVMFFVSNAARIAKFVNTVIDSVADVVRGNVSAVVNKINDVLGQMVPIIIGFLASVIGLGGIGQKIRQIIEKLQKPINKALDFVIKTGLKLAGPIIRGIKGISGKVKSKVAAGKAWVKGKAEAGKAWVKGKVDTARARLGGAKPRADLPADKQQHVNMAAREIEPKVRSMLSEGVPEPQLEAKLRAWKVEYRLNSLWVERSGGKLNIKAKVNPTVDVITGAVDMVGHDVSRILREIGLELMNDPQVQAEVEAIRQERETQRAAGAGSEEAPITRAAQSPVAEAAALRPPVEGQPDPRRRRWETERVGAAGQQVTEEQTYSEAPGHIHTKMTVNIEGKLHESARYIPEVQAALVQIEAAGISRADIQNGIFNVLAHRPPGGAFVGNTEAASQLASITRLMFAVEGARNPAALATSYMGTSMITNRGMPIEELATAANPMHVEEAGKKARTSARRLEGRTTRGRTGMEGQLMLMAERDVVIAYLENLVRTKELTFDSQHAVERFLREQFRQHLLERMRAAMMRAPVPSG